MYFPVHAVELPHDQVETGQQQHGGAEGEDHVEKCPKGPVFGKIGRGDREGQQDQSADARNRLLPVAWEVMNNFSQHIVKIDAHDDSP